VSALAPTPLPRELMGTSHPRFAEVPTAAFARARAAQREGGARRRLRAVTVLRGAARDIDEAARDLGARHRKRLGRAGRRARPPSRTRRRHRTEERGHAAMSGLESPGVKKHPRPRRRRLRGRAPGADVILARERPITVSVAADPSIALDKMQTFRPTSSCSTSRCPGWTGCPFLQTVMAPRPIPVVVCSRPRRAADGGGAARRSRGRGGRDREAAPRREGLPARLRAHAPRHRHAPRPTRPRAAPGPRPVPPARTRRAAPRPRRASPATTTTR
jgi:hypothetical protein